MANRRKRIKTETFELPDYWASYLINGDAYGLDDREQRKIDRWLESRPELGGCLSCDDENEFSTSNDAGELPGGTMKFTFQVIS